MFAQAFGCVKRISSSKCEIPATSNFLRLNGELNQKIHVTFDSSVNRAQCINIFLQVHGTKRVRPGEVLRGVPGGAASWEDSGRGIPEVNYDIEKSERERCAKKIVADLINHRIMLSILTALKKNTSKICIFGYNHGFVDNGPLYLISRKTTHYKTIQDNINCMNQIKISLSRLVNNC